MTPQFESLSEDQKELMYDTIPLLTVYIAGADGNIDAEETAWAEKVTQIRSYSYHEDLRDYYAKVGDIYAAKLEHYIDLLPQDVARRTVAIEEKLGDLNAILAKLDVNFAARFYKSLLSFAKHVAKASGGFLGFGSINRAEEKLLGLNFLNPIELEEEEDDFEEEI